MVTVDFSVVSRVVMDEFNQTDIIEMGKSIGLGGVNDIEGICQSAKVLSIKAMPVLEEIDCMAKEVEPTL